jgi:hypothetical protein
MPKSRSSQVSLIDTPYYHCVSRCVRRAFLWGTDKYSGTSYEHRRAWVEDKVLCLSSVFAMGICAYALTSKKLQRHPVRRDKSVEVRSGGRPGCNSSTW